MLLTVITKVDRFWSRLENICAGIAGVLIGMAMVLTVVEVISRKIFNAPLPGIIDVFELGMAAVAFFGVSQCQRVGGHVRMEMLVRRFHGRVLWAVEALMSTFALAFIAAVAMASIGAVERAYLVEDSTMDLLLPIWPAKVCVAIALAILTVRLLLEAVDGLRLTIDPTAEPVTASRVASVADHAREEIEEALGADAAAPDQVDRL